MKQAVLLIVGMFVVWPAADFLHLLVPESWERVGLYGTTSAINWIVYDCTQLMSRAYTFMTVAVATRAITNHVKGLPLSMDWVAKVAWMYAYVAVLQCVEVVLGVSGRGYLEQIVIWGPYCLGSMVSIVQEVVRYKRKPVGFVIKKRSIWGILLEKMKR